MEVDTWHAAKLRLTGILFPRKVRETRSSSSRKRPQPAAHPRRGPGGQAGDEHGGSPSFKGGVEPGRAPAGEGRELLRPSGDERVRSLSDRGAVSFKANFAACQPQAQRTPGALDHAQTHLIPYAAMSETSSNRWNLSVISDFSDFSFSA